MRSWIRSSKRIALPLAVLLGVALGAIGLERWGWAGRALSAETPERYWIWSGGDPRDARPTAFYARHDFELVAPPTSASITVLGDEEYILALNGVRVGSNRYASRAPLDRYEVGPLLRPGANRLVVELRSSTWTGGFTLRLEDAAGAVLVTTGGGWTIHREYFGELFSGGPPVGGEPATVLGRAPFGRWGRLVDGSERALFEDRLSVDRPLLATHFRTPGDAASWHPLSQRPGGSVSLGPVVEFDFGEVMTGYLQLSARGGAATGLAFFGTEPAGSLPRVADALVTTIRHRGLWQDAVPRRFRYVTVLGLEGVTSAAVLPLVETAVEELAPPAERGLLGARPPLLRSPVEDVLRRELEGVASFGVGELP